MKPLLFSLFSISSVFAGLAWYHYGIGYDLDKPQKMISPITHSDHHRTITAEDYAVGSLREKDVIERMTPRLTKELRDKGLQLGSPVFIRVFKESRELEIWVEHSSTKKYHYFKTWHIAALSGKLGPKIAEGDLQGPEGFYYVPISRMKPDSSYHLAFNIGYPNQYDQAHNRTGSFIMVHGNRLSVGCLAMTDPSIEEIYTLCYAALTGSQPFFRIHIFPFRMTDERLSDTKGQQWHHFWKNLKEGYDYFENTQTPPNVELLNKKYTFK